MSNKIKLLLTDFDGVLTDGSICYTENGEITKRFHVHDGMGLEILNDIGIKTGIVTSDDSPIVDKRATRLKFTHVLKDQSKGNKLSAVNELCSSLDIGLAEIAYMGDDVNCYDLLTAVGYPACPADAQELVRAVPNIFVTKLNGGRGAVREWINYLFAHQLFATEESLESLVARNFKTK